MNLADGFMLSKISLFISSVYCAALRIIRGDFKSFNILGDDTSKPVPYSLPPILFLSLSSTQSNSDSSNPHFNKY